MNSYVLTRKILNDFFDGQTSGKGLGVVLRKIHTIFTSRMNLYELATLFFYFYNIVYIL